MKTKERDDDEVGPPPTPGTVAPPLRYDWNESCFKPSIFQTQGVVPSRVDLVLSTDKGRKVHTKLLNDIYARQEVNFHPWDVQESNDMRERGVSGGRYQLNLFGILPDGAKAHVIVRNAPVYFGVWYPDKLNEEQQMQWFMTLQGLLQGTDLERVETGEAFPLKGYRESPRKYVKCFFPNLKSRKQGIEVARNHSMETFSDDRGNYFRLLARENHLPLCSWLTLNNYAYGQGGFPSPSSFLVNSDGQSRPVQDMSRNSPHATHVFEVSLENVKALNNPLKPDPEVEKRINNDPSLSRESLLVECYDIETHSPHKGLGTPPNASKAEDVVFMLCVSYHWRDDPKPIARFCLATQECAPDPRWMTIICGPGGSPNNHVRPNPSFGQDSLIMAFAELHKRFSPEVATGFNSSMYDDPFIVEKARQFGLLAEMDKRMSALPRWKSTDANVLRWQYSTERPIKITADKRVFVNFIKFPGCVPIDTRVMYQRIFPKDEKTSLNAFLKRVKLSAKADMPYTRMWKIYEMSVVAWDNYLMNPTQQTQNTVFQSAENMRSVAHYCVIDSVRCQELLVKRTAIRNNCEKGNFSFTSFSDTYLNADGHKVCNMLFAYCADSAESIGYPIYGSMIAVRAEIEGKYPGAFVVPAVKGQEEDMPVTGLDFTSLYPSLIQAYNLSLEKSVANEEEAQRLEAKGEKVHRVEFLFGGQVVRGWFVMHQGVPEKMGVFARVLADLFMKRAALKKFLKKYEAEIEDLESLLGAYRRQADGGLGFAQFVSNYCTDLKRNADKHTADIAYAKAEKQIDDLGKHEKSLKAVDTKLRAFNKLYGEGEMSFRGSNADPAKCSERILEVFEAELEEVEFLHAAIDSKQKAVKVFMNTFYGEAGNRNSPLFQLALAGGVTSMGQYNLKMVIEYVLKARFDVRYGDTDSVYVTCPHHVYHDVIQKYEDKLRELGIDTDTQSLLVPDVAAQIKSSRSALMNLFQQIADFASASSEGKVQITTPELLSACRGRMYPDKRQSAVKHLDEILAHLPGPHRASCVEALMGGYTRFETMRTQYAASMRAKLSDNSNWLTAIFAQNEELRTPVAEAYEALCKEKIAITMETMSNLRDEVNAMLKDDNGGKILKMAYEEVLHPVVFTGKKKYFGIAHINQPNYDIADASKIFVRGIDVVKQGQTKLSKNIGYECMWQATCLHPPGDRMSYINRVEEVIRETCTALTSFRANDSGTGKWKLEDFIQSDAWKPDKDNKSVQKFMRRMKVRHKMQLSENEVRERRGHDPLPLDFIEPEAGARFNYILVERGKNYNLQGYTSTKESKGDIMEYVDYAKKRNFRINVHYYLQSYVIGLCARFINYEARFEKPDKTADAKAQDEYSQKEAKKYLLNFIRSLNNTDRKSGLKRGTAYRRAYKNATQRACTELGARVGDISQLLVGVEGLELSKTDIDQTSTTRAENGIINFEIFLPPEEDDAPLLIELVRKAAQSTAQKRCDELEEPIQVWNPSLNHGQGGFSEKCLGLTDRIIERYGIDRTPEGRKALYSILTTLQPPRRAKLREKQYLPPPVDMEERYLAEKERIALMTIEDHASVLTDISERVQSTLEQLVSLERQNELKLAGLPFDEDEGVDVGPTGPEVTEEMVGIATESAVSGLDCTPYETDVLRKVHEAWHKLVTISTQRILRQNMLRRLCSIRDRAL